MSKTKPVCSAGMYISAGYCAVETMGIEPKRLLQTAISDFIYNYLPMLVLLI